MKVSFCGKFQKYVSKQYCDFFNEGQHCRYQNSQYWSSIKDLLGDGERPEPMVNEVIKPFQCRLLLTREQAQLERGAESAPGPVIQ